MTLFLTLLIVIITAIACTLIGNLLVLRRLSLMGDAISHAVLPGFIVAFFLSGTLDSPLFFILAILTALLMTFLINWLIEHVPVSSESLIGIVFTFLFALGVILLVQFARNVHLDQDAVLFGQVEFAALNRFVINGIDIGPRALWTMGFALILNLICLWLFYKEWKLVIFDPVMAKSSGISVKKMHYLLMALTSITVVLGFEVAGSILIVALLIVPAATAYVMSERLIVMILLSVLFAILASVSGYLLALQIDGSISGSVAMMSGIFLFLSLGIKRVLLKL